MHRIRPRFSRSPMNSGHIPRAAAEGYNNKRQILPWEVSAFLCYMIRPFLHRAVRTVRTDNNHVLWICPKIRALFGASERLPYYVADRGVIRIRLCIICWSVSGYSNLQSAASACCFSVCHRLIAFGSITSAVKLFSSKEKSALPLFFSAHSFTFITPKPWLRLLGFEVTSLLALS